MQEDRYLAREDIKRRTYFSHTINVASIIIT